MLGQRQIQSLQQKLSPQQIQLMKLLQLPTTAIEQRIQEELEVNPVLEAGDEFEEQFSAEGEITSETIIISRLLWISVRPLNEVVSDVRVRGYICERNVA